MSPDQDLLVDHLRARLGERGVLADRDTLESYRHDMATFCAAGTARVLVRPTSTEQVQQVILAARAHQMPVVTQGARTGLSGGATAVDGCILLSLERMD
jgi:glycolate oxidase